jgi:hypothetical protein
VNRKSNDCNKTVSVIPLFIRRAHPAIRNAEALGDPTIALALEAGRRRRSADVVRVCASHRVIRLLPFDVPGYSPHFRLFGLVTAGRDTGSFRFETAHLLEHVRVYLRLFRMLTAVGFALRSPLVADFQENDHRFHLKSISDFTLGDHHRSEATLA